MNALKRELPTTFRVTGSRAHANALNETIKTKYMPELEKVDVSKLPQLPGFDETATAAPPLQLPWYPGQLAWQIDAPKRLIRKSEEYRTFQRFLVGETEIGNISRQEAVSMIPPLLLDIEPHHYCLDMCAAPGSKTAQMMEALNPFDTESEGLLIANDSDAKRCHMLVHQTGRMPSVGLGVTNSDASLMTSIDTSKGQLLFDRILADVPCTGDGTMRKNFDIWKTWTAANGNMLHALQLRILLRAMNLLKPGGRMVYSTCSFNPVENEAVVAAALALNKGKFKIVPADATLPGLKRRPGWTSWKVAMQDNDKNLIWLDSHAFYEGYLAGAGDKHSQTSNASAEGGQSDEWRRGYEEGRSGSGNFRERILAPTLWAPEGTSEMGLEHCLRLVPHDQNTGGFFVCALERQGDGKVVAPDAADLRETAATEVPTESGVVEVGGKRARSASPAGESSKKPKREPLNEKQQRKFERQNGGFKEDPFFFLKPDDPEVQACIDYFKLNDTFPRDRLFVRNATGEANRIIYLGNPILKDVILSNDYTRIRLLSAGIRILVKQDTAGKNKDIACKWRIPSTGIDSLLPYMDKAQIIDATLADLKTFLIDQYPFSNKFTSEFGKVVQERPQGCHVVRFPAGESDGGSLALPLTMPIWKATNSISLMIDKKEKR